MAPNVSFGLTTYRVTKWGGRYIGRTGNFAARAARHARNGTAISRLPGLDRLSLFDSMAVEQRLIEHYGLANLANTINGIATSNPIYSTAISRAEWILAKIGFPLK